MSRYELWTVDFDLGRVTAAYEAQTGESARPVLGGSIPDLRLSQRIANWIARWPTKNPLIAGCLRPNCRCACSRARPRPSFG